LSDRLRPEEVDGLPIPPPYLQRLNGGRDFLMMGERIAQDLVNDAGLTAADDVLDIGCGSGRAALALTRIIGPDGSYQGFDVVPEAVRWCSRRITPRFPNFEFRWIDVRGDHYYRAGGASAEQADFDYKPESFDVVFATSVFTHLNTAATENYLKNAARVLRPGGRLYATFFFLDDHALRIIESGRADIAFGPTDDDAWVEKQRDPEAAVAHDRSSIEAVIDRSGLILDTTRRGGRWCHRPSAREYQDVLVATKA
jgi:SAM-dependent methyltransferase